MTFDIGLHEDCVRYVITKFSRMDSLPNFVTNGPPLRALRAQELRYDSKSQNRATYFFLNKTSSLSSNLKPHGIYSYEQTRLKFTFVSLNCTVHCGWIEASMLLALGPPQTECPDLTPSAEI